MESHLFSDLHCNLCNRLLSVPPILIDAKGQNICGRCRSDTESFKRNVRYEILAQQFSFPCLFAEEGCTIKKTFNEVKDHEDGCPYRIINCKSENCNWSGIPTELILHFQEHHKDNIISSNSCLKGLSKNLKIFMFKYENFNFLIESNYYSPWFSIKIGGLDLTPVRYSKFIFEFTLLIKNADTTTTIVNFVKLNSSHQLMLPTLTDLSLSLDVIVSGLVRKEDILKEITCPYCSCQMVPPIVRCREGHLSCVDCTDTDYDFCKICDTDEILFGHELELELLAASTLYKCRWKDCNGYFSVKEIQIHEQACCKRAYMCLHCPRWKGFLNQLPEHDESCTSKSYVCPLLFTTKLTVQAVKIPSGENWLEYSLVAHKELFILMLNKASFGIEVAICNCGPPSCFGWYHYEVLLQHLEDLDSPYNQIYTYKYKSSNRHTIEIPNSDIIKFDSPELFKITVLIHKLDGDRKKKNTEKYFKSFKWALNS